MSTLHLSIHMQKKCLGGFGRNPAFSKDKWSVLKERSLHVIQECEKRKISTIFCAHIPSKKFIGKLSELEKNDRDWLAGRGKGYSIDFALDADAMLAMNGHYSVCQESPLPGYLKKTGIENILLSGWSEWYPKVEGFCINETARDLRKDGYNVFIVAEATNAALWPTTLLAERQKAFAARGIHVLPLEELMARLDATAPQPRETKSAALTISTGRSAVLTL